MEYISRVNISIILYKTIEFLEEDGSNSLAQFDTLVGINYLDGFILVFKINIILSNKVTRVFSY